MKNTLTLQPSIETLDRALLFKQLRGVIISGMVIIAIFFIGLVGWSATAKLASASVAPGIVNPENLRRTVQHLEGGIVHEILVQEGNTVVAGQPLVVLKNIAAKSTNEQTKKEYLLKSITMARLTAGLTDYKNVEIPAWILEAAQTDSSIERAIEETRKQFVSERESYHSRVSIQERRIVQLRATLDGNQRILKTVDGLLQLGAKELKDYTPLANKGLVPMTQVRELERTQLRLQGERSHAENSIIQARNGIEEAQLTITSLRSDYFNTLSAALNALRPDVENLKERLQATADILNRTVITAPISGQIVQLKVNTIGGVIRGGDPILDIVPTSEELIIDVHISPSDIDMVKPGLSAVVNLLAYRQRLMPKVNGVVKSVSADSITDPGGNRYYLARVTVSADELAKHKNEFVLTPGMETSVLILTGERTLLEYLLRPAIEIMQKSLRD